jgi:DNA repair exonuclease SbcCD ATPase subunit
VSDGLCLLDRALTAENESLNEKMKAMDAELHKKKAQAQDFASKLGQANREKTAATAEVQKLKVLLETRESQLQAARADLQRVSATATTAPPVAMTGVTPVPAAVAAAPLVPGPEMSDKEQKRILTRLVQATRRVYKPQAVPGSVGQKMSIEDANKLSAMSLGGKENDVPSTP